MKLIIAIGIIAITLISGASGYLLGIRRAGLNVTVPAATIKTELSPKVESLLEAEFKRLRQVAEQPSIASEIKRSSEKNRKLTAALINQFEQNWIKLDPDSETLRPYLINPAAASLREFQQTNPYYTEAFITDNRGLVVAMTNKTSDYLQADEAWWVESFAGGKGKPHHGQIEFDDSSQTEAIAFYQPIEDPTSHQVIGILKAVLDISAIKSQL